MVQRIDFVVSSSAADRSFSVDLSSVAALDDEFAPRITIQWIRDQIEKNLELTNYTVKSLKYEDDEADLVTFVTDEELLEALTIADVAAQNTLRIFADVEIEFDGQCNAEENLAQEAAFEQYSATEDPQAEEKKNERTDDVRAQIMSLAQSLASYVGSLTAEAKELFSNAVQVGIQEMKDGLHVREAVQDILSFLPDGKSLDDLRKRIGAVAHESWESLNAHVRKMSKEQWENIEARIPKLMEYLPMVSAFLSSMPSNLANAFRSYTGGQGTGSGEVGGFNPLSMLSGFPFGGQSPFFNSAPAASESNLDAEITELKDEENLTVFCEPGTKIIKTWTIRNNGSRPWPAGVRLVAQDSLSESLLSAENSALVLPEAAPGESVTISQLLEVPNVPGSFIARFKLQSLYGHGPAFGPEIPMEIYVTA